MSAETERVDYSRNRGKRRALRVVPDRRQSLVERSWIEELDVQGILTFAERVLPRAADLWVQATLNQKQRLQQLFLPEGILFDGNRLNRTAATAPFFKHVAPGQSAEESLVSPEGIEPSTNRLRVCRRGSATRSKRHPPTNPAKCSPVSVFFPFTNSPGGPSNTTRPPSCPAPGPRSMIQSACAITAW